MVDDVCFQSLNSLIVYDSCWLDKRPGNRPTRKKRGDRLASMSSTKFLFFYFTLVTESPPLILILSFSMSCHWWWFIAVKSSKCDAYWNWRIVPFADVSKKCRSKHFEKREISAPFLDKHHRLRQVKTFLFFFVAWGRNVFTERVELDIDQIPN